VSSRGVSEVTSDAAKVMINGLELAWGTNHDTHSHFFGMGAFCEGIMWPLGICSIGGWLIVSPTHFEHWRVPVPWFALPHLCPPLIHSPNPP